MHKDYAYSFCCPRCNGDTLLCLVKGVESRELTSLEQVDGKLGAGEADNYEFTADTTAEDYYGCKYCGMTWKTLEELTQGDTPCLKLIDTCCLPLEF